MNIEFAREYCLSKKGTLECLPFDDDCLVFKVMGKMFALVGLKDANRICLKCEPEYAIELRERFSAVEVAFHFDKKHWNQILFNSDVNDKLIIELIDHSYNEVLKKFTKKLRAEYDAL